MNLDRQKHIQHIYKNLVEDFNPSTKILVNSAKAYLKALHGASSASLLYLDSLGKVAQEASKHNKEHDIGECLTEITNFYKEIHQQQINILKSFYVDLIVPLEHNLEKDAKVIQGTLKTYQNGLKSRTEAYQKASSIVKKTNKRSNTLLDKEIRGLQNLEEERSKLEAFMDKSMKQALMDHSRRYGFILDRETTLLKLHLSLYGKGQTGIQEKIEKWDQVAKAATNQLAKPSSSECIYCSTSNLSIKNPVPETISRARYPYHTNRENQLNFVQGDDINVQGERVNGWQFGENTRTKKTGWFPIAYIEDDNNLKPPPPPPTLPPDSSSESLTLAKYASTDSGINPPIDYSDDSDNETTVWEPESEITTYEACQPQPRDSFDPSWDADSTSRVSIHTEGYKNSWKPNSYNPTISRSLSFTWTDNSLHKIVNKMQHDHYSLWKPSRG